jgi:hypothetical protein
MHNNRRSTFEFFYWKSRDNAEIAPEKCAFQTKSAIYIAYCSYEADVRAELLAQDGKTGWFTTTAVNHSKHEVAAQVRFSLLTFTVVPAVLD